MVAGVSDGSLKRQTYTCRSTQSGAYNSYTRLPTMAFASKKDDEGLSAYYNNKTTVIQEARVFNDSPISPRKCRALLTRVVHLLYIGESFNAQEATTLFFGTTKLFQHKDVRPFLLRLANLPDQLTRRMQSALRQMVYLAIKELAGTAEDVIMVTSSIMKDMQPNSEVIYRPNSIRALCRIIDVCFSFS
jgi:coatomer protein complex subunit gamma